MLASLTRSYIGNGQPHRSIFTMWNSILRYLKILDVNSSNNQGRCFHTVTGDIITPSQVMGIDHLRDPRLNKGLAFTIEERQALGIHGLQPPRYKSMEEQLELCKVAIERYQENLNKYLYLSELFDRNEKLFFRLLCDNVETLMPIVYTPTVGLACQKFGLIYRRPRGLFITINDSGHVFDIIKNWPEHNVRAVCVTDGERILGLGDLGANGMGIPVGKLALYTALGGIKPFQCLPILLDVGTNNQSLLEDPTYVGLRQRRVTGAEYDKFIKEFIEAVVKRYGQNTLIQFEDFGNHNAFRILEQYRNKYCTFNDDIQGTASAVVAGLLACQRLTNRKVSENTFLFFGAGGAALGTAHLLIKAMEQEGVSLEQARNKIWLMDIHGLLTKNRTEEIKGDALVFAKNHSPEKSLQKVIESVKPTALIGASTVGGSFTPEVLSTLAKHCDKPIIFALSNPTSNAECTAQEAFDHTKGRCVFASGSPFPPVQYNGVEYKTGQGNNAYIFPGIALGVITSGMHHISEEVFLIAAQTTAENVPEEEFKHGNVFPKLSEIRELSIKIAMRLCQYAYDKGLASVYPEPKDKRSYIKSIMYNFNYEPALPVQYAWPKMPEIKTKRLEPVTLHGVQADNKSK